jgi:hypothetical protein
VSQSTIERSAFLQTGTLRAAARAFAAPSRISHGSNTTSEAAPHANDKACGYRASLEFPRSVERFHLASMRHLKPTALMHSRQDEDENAERSVRGDSVRRIDLRRPRPDEVQVGRSRLDHSRHAKQVRGGFRKGGYGRLPERVRHR